MHGSLCNVGNIRLLFQLVIIHTHVEHYRLQHVGIVYLDVVDVGMTYFPFVHEFGSHLVRLSGTSCAGGVDALGHIFVPVDVSYISQSISTPLPV